MGGGGRGGVGRADVVILRCGKSSLLMSIPGVCLVYITGLLLHTVCFFFFYLPCCE